MWRNVTFLTCLALVLGFCGNTAAIEVPQGETVTLTGTVVDNNDVSYIAGTLIIGPDADVTWSGQAVINGVRDMEAGVGAEIIMNGGSFHLIGDDSTDRMTVGSGGHAWLIINSGYFRLGSDSSSGRAGYLMPGDEPGCLGPHRIYVNGGTLRTKGCKVDGNGTRDTHIFVGDGTFIIEEIAEGDVSDPEHWQTQINQSTGEPILQPAEGYVLVIEDYNYGKVVTTHLGPWARDPAPERDKENVCPDVVLEWTAGPQTQATMGHDVYLGTDFNDVNDATTSSAVYEGRQTETTFDPSPDLTSGTVYYWRVDQVNDVEAESPWKGYTWSFTTNDGNAFDPDPEDDETKVALDKVLSWTAGCGASLHDVYFSTDFNDVNDMATTARVADDQPGTTYDPCDFDFLVDYYWRVVEDDTYIGPVWHFRAKSAIVDENMILWYEFNETDGNTVPDSSGYQFHGTGVGIDSNNWQADSQDGGGSISMDGGQRIEVPVDDIRAELSSDEISICAWVKEAWNPGQANWVFGAGFDVEIYDIDWSLAGAIPTSSGGDVLFIAGEVPKGGTEHTEEDSKDVIRWTSREGASPEGLRPDWHHLVFIKNENADTMSIYLDGLLAHKRTDANDDTLGSWKTRFDIFNIGSHWQNDSNYVGRIDDFRIYNKALSPEEVASLFRGGDFARAWAPTPFNGASNVVRDANLTWRPGDFATHHDVYFGTGWDDVNDATTSSDEYDGRQPLGVESYDPPGNLELGKSYYWRIDEVNEANEPDDIWKGNVWTFTVANFVVIDDFESYDNADNRIYYSWIDLIGGSQIDLGIEPFSPAHGGYQSMLFSYDNTANWGGGYYSEVELPLGGPQDFTQGGMKALTLYFYGDPTNDSNDTEELYVGLGGSYDEVRYSDDHGNDNNDLKLAEWTEWNIRISEFAGVDPCAVTSLFIGFGQRGSAAPGGTGVVYFDDIRLYPPRCVPELGPIYDWSGNCVVDWEDVGIMSNEWLRRDAQLSVAEPAVGPVAHWELDDTGAVATDSAGSNNGTLEGSVSWVAGKVGSGAAEFGSYDARIRVPHSAELMPAATVSVTAWIYPTQVPGYEARVVAKGIDTDNWEAYFMQFGGSASWAIRDPNHENHPLSGSELRLDDWTHVAGTYDGDALKIYIDGQLDAEDSTGGMDLLQDANDLSIGNRSDGNDRAFIGRIDDVRVYDYALNALEVAYGHRVTWLWSLKSTSTMKRIPAKRQ
ncbi:MAG: LamG domain-containing protein [Planctomycetota bacterium]|jgi:hypothetical protein